MVYDVSEKETYDNLNKWIAFVKQFSNKDLLGILIGNKIDLPDKQVSTERGKNFAEAENLFFMETSAKTSENVAEAFGIIANKIVERILKDEESEKEKWSSENLIKLPEIAEPEAKKGCC